MIVHLKMVSKLWLEYVDGSLFLFVALNLRVMNSLNILARSSNNVHWASCCRWNMKIYQTWTSKHTYRLNLPNVRQDTEAAHYSHIKVVWWHCLCPSKQFYTLIFGFFIKTVWCVIWRFSKPYTEHTLALHCMLSSLW